MCNVFPVSYIYCHTCVLRVKHGCWCVKKWSSAVISVILSATYLLLWILQVLLSFFRLKQMWCIIRYSLCLSLRHWIYLVIDNTALLSKTSQWWISCRVLASLLLLNWVLLLDVVMWRYSYCCNSTYRGGPKNGTVFWYALTSSNINWFFKIISLSESGENL